MNIFDIYNIYLHKQLGAIAWKRTLIIAGTLALLFGAPETHRTTAQQASYKIVAFGGHIATAGFVALACLKAKKQD